MSGVVSSEVPAGIRLDDGLTPDEAVALAIWNAAFQVSVSQLGFARADLLEALGILLVLQVDFGSVRLVALVAWTIPFALIGGVASVFLIGGVLSLGSLVGFVTVPGHCRP